ncbi:GNAT superfamily N-acetyltransferase [Bradyrhizobium japonicum]
MRAYVRAEPPNSVAGAQVVNIREATNADAAAISELTRDLTLKNISHEFPLAGRLFLDNALSAEQVRRNMQENCRYHVCEKAGCIVGVVAMRANRHLLKLFVAEIAQGQGIARALWTAAKQACIRSGHRGPFTVSAARGAEPVYRQLGFVRSGDETTENGVTRVPMHSAS